MNPSQDPVHDPDIELSVVIPAYNAATTIEEQLQALGTQVWSGSWEVIVADNGSTDATLDLVKAFSESHAFVQLVDASQDRGASHARNVGVAIARGTSIAFCDADDVVGEGWVSAMGDGLRAAPFVTGPQEYERLNPRWLWGVYGTTPARELQTFSGIFPFGASANLGVQREHFERIGGFDASISPFEDLDLCLRLWLQDIELCYLPQAVVHYRYRPDLRSLWRQAVSYGTAAPAIARQLELHKRPTPPRWAGLRRYVWLVRRLPSLRTKAGRARWLVVAGTVVGRLQGSVRARWLLF